ncbi:MAG: FtsX-like permease family protein [Roseivirga sp.]|nr:FtsX-like permease family protein [Roseivirga sp.]
MNKLLRTLWKNKTGTGINLIGLASAFTISFLILIYVNHEGNYDAFHGNTDRIFRLNTLASLNGDALSLGKNSYPAGPMLEEAYPDVKNYLRLINTSERTVTSEPDVFIEKRICYADASLLHFFDFPLLAGSDVAMDQPNSMIINRDVAIKYFGSPSEAVGKTLKMGQELNAVVGVIDIPSQSHVLFDFFISTSTLPDTFVTPRNSDYLWMTGYTYIMLGDGVTSQEFEARLSSFYESVLIPFAEDNDLGFIRYTLQPLVDIHVNNELRYDYPGNIDKGQLTIFAYLAFAILLIASINYMNLFTAQVTKRMIEVGIRKTFGASNSRLVGRFTMETLVVAFSAFVIALGLMYLLFPSFNNLLELDLVAADTLMASLPWMLLLVLVLGFVSGIYPALFVSGMSPLEMMVKSDSKSSRGILSKTLLRKGLVTFQLAVSSALMITIFVVSSQLDFLFGKDLGFNKDAVYVVDIPNDRDVATRLELIKERLKNNANVLAVAGSSAVPGKIEGRLTFDVDQQDAPNIIAFNYVNVDSEFLDVLGIELEEGRNFMKASKADLEGAYMVNRALARHVSWDDPLQKRLVGADRVGRVAGVISDFNHASLHNPIEPLVMFFTESTRGYQLIKLNGANLNETVAYIEETWRTFAPEHPFTGFFLDDSFNAQYNKEARLKSMFMYIGVLAIVITALGLIGMTLFTIERKLKEISIRRVIGATSGNVVRLLTKEYVPVVVIANAIAIPLTIYGLDIWLSSFAFQAEVSTLLYAAVFALNGALVLMVILPMTLSVLRKNLINALRIE